MLVFFFEKNSVLVVFLAAGDCRYFFDTIAAKIVTH
jgi:hypothetical protein